MTTETITENSYTSFMPAEEIHKYLNYAMYHAQKAIVDAGQDDSSGIDELPTPVIIVLFSAHIINSLVESGIGHAPIEHQLTAVEELMEGITKSVIYAVRQRAEGVH